MLFSGCRVKKCGLNFIVFLFQAEDGIRDKLVTVVQTCALPISREVVAAVVAGLDLSNEAFPFMAASVATIAGVAGRVFRISFSGELAYELAVPAGHALAVRSEERRVG